MARRKLNSEINSLRETTVSGILGETVAMTRNDGSPAVGKFGQELWTFELADKKTGEIKKYWGDGGLKGAFSLSKVKPGMHIEIVHTGEKEIEQGTVQTYDLFDLS